MEMRNTSILFLLVLLIQGSELAQSPNSGYLRKGTLNPYVREILRPLGDRMEAPGKERLSVSGTLIITNGSQKSTAGVVVAWEFPDNLRIDDQRPGAGRTLIW